MDRKIREIFNDRIRREAGARFGVDGDEMEALDGFESFIYRYGPDISFRILRIAHSTRRSGKLIQGEVDWIRCLAEHGIPVADAVPSPGGNLVEFIPDGQGGHFLATSFRGIRGKAPWDFGWSRELFLQYGELIGKMHRLAKSYEPAAGSRPSWNSAELGGDIPGMIPADQEAVRKRFAELEDTIASFPRGNDSFELVHYDAHGGNMLIDARGIINLFDFDDCCLSWYACDIAIVLFYMVTNAPDPDGAAERFLVPFLTGYSRENRLDRKWLESLPLFLKLREINLYSVIHRSMDPDSLTGWCAAFMDGRRKRIEEGIPFLGIDFCRFSECLG